jgi:hypothetical protein
MVLIVVVVLVLLGAGWLLVVSPERHKANGLNSKVSGAQSQLSTAQAALASAQAAKAQYPKAYASVVTLGKAVPAEQEVPSLIYQLEQASNSRSVDFNSIVSGGGSATASSSTSGAAASAKLAGFTQMPFTFVFSGGFFSLEHLFGGLTKFTAHTTSGGLEVSGRLLTIQSVKLAPENAGPAGTVKGPQRLSGTITATAYVLPPSQGLTGGASESAPGGSPSPAAAQSPSSPTAPAIAKVTP